MTKLSTTCQNNLVLGYCCINTALRKQKPLPVFTSRTCRLKTIEERGIEYSYQLAHQNLNDLPKIFQWNFDHNIFLFRMSSDMFPFATHKNYIDSYDMNQFNSVLQNIGNLAKKFKQTITFHPSQFTLLSSTRPEVTANSVIDINFHAQLLDKMNAGPDSIIVIHGGSKAGGKKACLDRLCENFQLLSPSAQKRLVLENCETCYTIQDLLPVSQKLQVPIVVDFHHHNINPGTAPLSESIQNVLQIWKTRGITPLFHLSESRPGVTPTDSILKRRAHSDIVETLPQELIHILHTTKIHLDIEAKHKEIAVLHLYKKYFEF